MPHPKTTDSDSGFAGRRRLSQFAQGETYAYNIAKRAMSFRMLGL